MAEETYANDPDARRDPRQSARLVRLSKWVSLRLRHNPAAIGLTLDPHGWAAVDDLISASARHGVRFTRADLDRLR